MTDPGASNRISRLEAIRGLGALAVLVNHSIVLTPWDTGSRQFALALALIVGFNGHVALMMFFVISGYVLGLSLDRSTGRAGSLRQYYVRRVFRIYPAHVVAIGFIAIVYSLFDRTQAPAGATPMYAAWSAPLSVANWVSNALLLRVDMNGIGWTLALEVAISILLPALYWTSRHKTAWMRWAPLAGLVALSFVVGDRLTREGASLIRESAAGPVRSVLTQFAQLPEVLNNLAQYAYVFYLGLVAEPVVRRLLSGRGERWKLWLLPIVWLAAAGSTRSSFVPAWSLLEVTGATFVVFCAASLQGRNTLTKVLDSPFFTWLGSVSYSFYLYHFIFLFIVSTVLFRSIEPGAVSANPLAFAAVLATFTFLLTVVVAAASHRLVELPMMAYSKGSRLSLAGLTATVVVGLGAAAVAPLLRAEAWRLAPETVTDVRPPDRVTLPVRLALGDDASRGWMADGWHPPEVRDGRPFVWSDGPASVLRAPLPHQVDLRLDLELMPFVFPGSPAQRVTVVLNGAEVTTVDLAEGIGRYTAVLPAAALGAPIDTLEFRYTYARAPREVLHNSLDSRLLAVSWYVIELSAQTP